MFCVVRQDVHQLVLALFMFVNSVNGDAQTTISCESGGIVIGQPQVISSSISGSIMQDIYWYRYNATYNETIVLCSKTGPHNVGSCVAHPNLRSKYNVSTEPQPPRNPSFTIISVTAEDLEVFWLCVDSTTFPTDISSIPDSSTCSLKKEIITTPSSSPTTDTEETTTILPNTTTEVPVPPVCNCAYSLVAGVAFLCDFGGGVVVSILITLIIKKGQSNLSKILIFVVFAVAVTVASVILSVVSYALCIYCLVSIGGIVGINIAGMIAVLLVTFVFVKCCDVLKAYFCCCCCLKSDGDKLEGYCCCCSKSGEDLVDGCCWFKSDGEKLEGQCCCLLKKGSNSNAKPEHEAYGSELTERPNN